MTEISKAAQQALDALIYHVEQTRPIERTTQAITALRAALQDKAGEVRIPVAGPSTYEQRFAEAVRLLTHASPPACMVTSWLDHTSEDLQHWIGSQKGTPEWAQCLAITDAAHAMAISPIEGEQHDFEPSAAQPATGRRECAECSITHDPGTCHDTQEGAAQPAPVVPDDHPLMIFAKECELGAYMEHEVPMAARKAIAASQQKGGSAG